MGRFQDPVRCCTYYDLFDAHENMPRTLVEGMHRWHGRWLLRYNDEVLALIEDRVKGKIL